MKMKCAGEVMLPLEAFPYIPYWFTLRQALAERQVMETDRKSSPGDTPWIILVFNAQSQFMGIVQRQDILRGFSQGMQDKIKGQVSSYSTTPDPNLSRLGFSPEKGISELKAHIERQIIEFMTPVQITVDFKDPIMLAFYLMVDHNLTFVPVVKAGQVEGVIYIEDALNEVIASIM
jgi:signal-transduction protein with cAMP-binding, CBS, and nucleotidyltransferase domain